MTANTSMSVMLVEDHSVARDAYAELLRQERPAATFIECSSVSMATGRPPTDPQPDLIVANYELAGGPTLSGLRLLGQRYAGIPIILIDGPADPQLAVTALEAGAAGYVPRTMRGECILQAFRLVLVGERFIPSMALGATSQREPQLPMARMPFPEFNAPIASLSPRRRQILAMVAGGAPNKVIARALSVHEVTVKSHLRVIFKALGVNTRTQAARMAMHAGLAPAEPPQAAESSHQIAVLH